MITAIISPISSMGVSTKPKDASMARGRQVEKQWACAIGAALLATKRACSGGSSTSISDRSS